MYSLAFNLIELPDTKSQTSLSDSRADLIQGILIVYIPLYVTAWQSNPSSREGGFRDRS